MDLARYFPLCSLPNSRSKLEKKIQISQESFKQTLPEEDRNYLFVLEDKQEKKIIGSSQILSYFGANQSLCYFLEEKEKELYLKLDSIKTGRHQIGGLILHPDYRRSQAALGLQIGLVRFLYIKTFPQEFSSIIEVSLTAPIHKGKNHFWEETGQKHLKMDYSLALKNFQDNRPQFFSLFPENLKISFSQLSSKAKNYLKQVHPQTLPVYKGLLKRGFYKTKHYHVLDGGIYLEVHWDKLSFLKKTKKPFLKKEAGDKASCFLLSQQTKQGFFCCQIRGIIKNRYLLVKTFPKEFEEGKQALVLKFPF